MDSPLSADRNTNASAALAAVDRRRYELFGITFLLLVAFAAATVVLSFGGLAEATFEDLGGTVNVVRGALVALSVAFAAYVFDKERQLRRATRALLDQQVLASALDQRLRQILSLTDASRRVVTTLELDDLLDLVLSAAAEIFDADDGSVLLVEGDELLVAAVHGREDALVGERAPAARGIAGHVLETGKPLLIGRDVPGELPQEAGHRRGITSAMSAPLRIAGEPIGVMNLNVTTGPRRFEPSDLKTFGYFADHAAVGIHNARNLRRERVRSEVIEAAAQDLESSLSVVVDALKALGAESELWAENGQRAQLDALSRRAGQLLESTECLFRGVRPTVGTGKPPTG